MKFSDSAIMKPVVFRNWITFTLYLISAQLAALFINDLMDK